VRLVVFLKLIHASGDAAAYWRHFKNFFSVYISKKMITAVMVMIMLTKIARQFDKIG